MITPELLAPPAIVSYTHRHWRGYTPECWIKHSPTLKIKLSAGANYTVFGIFDPATIGQAPSIASTLARSRDDGTTVITTPSDPHAQGVLCMAIAAAF